MGSQLSVDGVHVVVVGGGFGGIAAAQGLKSRGIPFTLIDLRDAFHHNVAALRAAVQNGFAQQTFIPYFETFGESFLQGRVVRVDPVSRVVVLDGGKEVSYSHLILCTGSHGLFPGWSDGASSYRTAIQKYEDLVKEVQAAGVVLVVGGGSTGAEMAAEIKTEYPDKKVILIHSGTGLADPDLLPSVRQQAKEVLLEKGVELLLGQRVSNLASLEVNVTRKDTVITTDQGAEITADLVICCTGSRVNSSAYSSALGPSVAGSGALKVNEHLQVEGHDNVFAVGDCAEVGEPRLAYHAGLHAEVAVSNIANGLSGKALASYRPGRVSMLLALGPDDGVGQFSGWPLPRWIVTQGKSKNLMLWKSWKEMGQSPPPQT